MENDKLIARYDFKILTCEADFRNKLTLPHTLDYVINCFCNHAETFGFRFDKISYSGLTWVLVRFSIDMERYPLRGKHIIIETWIEDVNKYFLTRGYFFYDTTGKCIGRVRSVWSVIDKNTRKTKDLTSMGLSKFVFGKESVTRQWRKIIENDSSLTKKDKFTVKYSDVDFNGHLNSAKYIEHIIDVFTLHKFSKRDIESFDIEYLSEVPFGTEIEILKYELENDEFVVVMKKDNGEVACRSRIKFGEQKYNDVYSLSSQK